MSRRPSENSGKTSTLRMLATLQDPSAGTLCIDGVDVQANAEAARRRVGYLPDNFALSKARADMVAGIVRGSLSHPERVTSQGFGDARPIASNSTPQGKSLNRRVEIVIQRDQ